MRKATLIWFSGYDKPYRTITLSMRAIYAILGVFGFFVLSSVLLCITMAVYHYQVSSRLEQSTTLSTTIEQQRGIIDELTQKTSVLERENSEKRDQIDRMHTLENRLRQFFGIKASELGKYPNQGGKSAPVETPSVLDIEKDTSGKIGTARPESIGLADVVAQVEDQLKTLSAVPTMLPVKGSKRELYISGKYGWRTDPITGNTKEFHSGLDICGPFKTPIVAPADGTVIESGFDAEYGNCIRILHAESIKTLYAHLSASKVKVGQKVKRGDVIGLMGNTGRSTGTHLHYSVYKSGRSVNPMDYIWDGFDSPLASR